MRQRTITGCGPSPSVRRWWLRGQSRSRLKQEGRVDMALLQSHLFELDARDSDFAREWQSWRFETRCHIEELVETSSAWISSRPSSSRLIRHWGLISGETMRAFPGADVANGCCQCNRRGRGQSRTPACSSTAEGDTRKASGQIAARLASRRE